MTHQRKLDVSFGWTNSKTYCESQKCCRNMKLENVNGEYIYVYWRQVDGYDPVNEFVDFYDNRRKIIRKSVCHRK